MSLRKWSRKHNQFAATLEYSLCRGHNKHLENDQADKRNPKSDETFLDQTTEPDPENANAQELAL